MGRFDAALSELHAKLCFKLVSSRWAYLDCHVIVTNPIDYVRPLGKAGASGFTFHVEVSEENWQELIQRM
ncbi:hypothetical protein SLE2022_266830 [Rubroshorea leprosula]